MQLPPIDRNPNLRTPVAGVESVSAKVVPAVPPVGDTASLNPRPSVINLVGLSNKSTVGEAVYTSVSDRLGGRHLAQRLDHSPPRPRKSGRPTPHAALQNIDGSSEIGLGGQCRRHP